MDKHKRTYLFTRIEGIAMILFGVLTLIESFAILNDVTINEGAESFLISLILIFTAAATLLGACCQFKEKAAA